MKITIAVDAMSGDFGPKVTIPAALCFLQDYPEVSLILVGNRDILERELKGKAHDSKRLFVQHASEVVDMDDLPQVALRSKKDSSMRVSLNLIKSGAAQAAVSAGNTGALIAIAHFVLKMIPGIERPAIAKLLPTRHSLTCALDLGATIDSNPERLVQFGIMGSELMSALMKIEKPSVGLLNVGTEDIKGSETIREAAKLIKTTSLNYYGYVEGNDIYQGTVDVVVTDGFTGNIALKASEGLAHMINAFLREEFSRGWYSKMAALIAMPVLKRLRKRGDARRYNGASLLGLRGSVVKSHGGTDQFGFYFAIVQAYKEASNDLIGHITICVEQHLKLVQNSAQNKTDTTSKL